MNKITEAILQRLERVTRLVFQPSIEIGEYSWSDIYPFFKGIHRHNCNEISFDWYNRLVFMKTTCKIKIIGTQSDVMWEIQYWKHNSTMKKN